MEELINKLKEKVKIIPVDSLEKQYKTVDDIYNAACMINDVFLLLLADDSVDVDEALSKLSTTDIINGYLLAYYDYSIEEVEEKSALLLELVKKENLNKDDVIYNYINLNIIVNDEEKKRRYKKIFPILMEDFIDEKEKELEQEREKLVQQLGDSSEKFINLLNELSSVKKFHNMYKNMCYCYSEDGFNFDKKVLKDFLQTTYDFALTDSLSIARRLAVKHRETHNILSLIIAVGDLKKELPAKKSSLRKKLAYCKKQDFKWIARDYNSLLFVYVKEPYVEGIRFKPNRSDDRIPFELSYDDLFSFIEWGKNKEPIFIQDILDNCKIIEGDKEEF